MREILPGVFTWSKLSEPHGYHFNGWLFRRPEGNVIVDPVEPDEATRCALALSAPGPWIVVTNRNHARAANLVRRVTGGRTLIHPDDAPHAREQGLVVEGTLAPGQRVGPFTVVPVPGKSPGEIALHWPERRLLVVGDAFVGDPPGRLKLLREQVIDDVERLRASIRAVAALAPTTLLLGDGASILEAGDVRLGELIGSFP